jgi:uncharacterized protein (TIGR02611 family)
VSQEETRQRRSPLIERVRARQARHRQRNRFYRLGFAVLGFLVLLAGVVMLVTPGPGIPVLVLGLGMLALEFAWAERWLERILGRAEQAVDQLTQGSRLRQAVAVGIGLATLAASIALILLVDIPYLPG